MSPKLVESKLAKIIELNMHDVFEKIENLPKGKSIYFHDLDDLEIRELKERFDKRYLIKEMKDMYNSFFNDNPEIKKYMVLVDRIF